MATEEKRRITGKQFFENVMTVLEEIKCTRKELCEYTGISQSQITNWNIKNNIPSADNALLIADFLQVSPEWLVFGKIDEYNSINSKVTAKKVYQIVDPNGTRNTYIVYDLRLPIMRKLHNCLKERAAFTVKDIIYISNQVHIPVDCLIDHYLPKKDDLECELSDYASERWENKMAERFMLLTQENRIALQEYLNTLHRIQSFASENFKMKEKLVKLEDIESKYSELRSTLENSLKNEKQNDE